jgi:nucleoid DNA-binding protein
MDIIDEINKSLKIRNRKLVKKITDEFVSLLARDVLDGKKILLKDFLSMRKEIMPGRKYVNPQNGIPFEKQNYYKIKVKFLTKFTSDLKSRKIYKGE